MVSDRDDAALEAALDAVHVGFMDFLINGEDDSDE